MAAKTITDGTSTFEVVYHKATFKGMIMPFSGSFDSDGFPIDGSTNIVRKDWHICDGTNGTPDLRGRFILGANSGHAVGSTGGEENHTLTIDELPRHGHRIALTKGGYPNTEPQSILYHAGQSNNDINGTFSDRRVSGTYGDGNSAYYYQSEFIEQTGNNQSHNNMPPYYALSYIMKV